MAEPTQGSGLGHEVARGWEKRLAGSSYYYDTTSPPPPPTPPPPPPPPPPPQSVQGNSGSCWSSTSVEVVAVGIRTAAARPPSGQEKDAAVPASIFQLQRFNSLCPLRHRRCLRRHWLSVLVYLTVCHQGGIVGKVHRQYPSRRLRWRQRGRRPCVNCQGVWWAIGGVWAAPLWLLSTSMTSW